MKENKLENYSKPFDALDCAMVLLHTIPDDDLAKILKRKKRSIMDKRYALKKKMKNMRMVIA